VWCLVGPTASGKTALAIELAARAPIEVVSADSRMIYRWLDIGTAKPDGATLQRVPHHVVDVVDPDEPFTVVDWVALARRAIRRITARGRQPLIVGGTGLYFRALCDGLDIPPVAPNDRLRAELESLASRDGWQALQSILREVDPLSATRIEGRNVRRVIRAIEVSRATGRPFSDWQRRSEPPFAARWVGLDLPVPLADAVVAKRVQEQFDAGLVAEVQGLRDRGFAPSLAPLQGLAYREAAQLLDGEVSPEEAVRRYAASTRHYARRQRSWFRPDARIRWFDARTANVDDVLAHFVQ
jgi:tRNA dimethylallyltransferase